MSPVSEITGPCLESTGFLFSHPCSRPASAYCMRCEKRVCSLHFSLIDAETVCSTCAREGAADDEDESSDTSRDEDDPSYYYEDYGYYGPGSSLGSGRRDTSHDPNDFTEADGESLRHEDDASFEEDLGGS